METYAVCPHCKCQLERYEEFGHDFDDMYVFVYWGAMCPSCQRTFSFTETFKLVERDPFNEEEEN